MKNRLSLDMSADPSEFDEATTEFAARRVITRVEADKLEDYAKRRAWWISGVAQMDVVNDAHRSILEALKSGIPFEDWKAQAGPAIEEAWGKANTPRLLTIFRNATTQAYNAGRWEQMHEPHVVSMRPFIEYDVVDDLRTTEHICRPLIGVILPIDDPFVLRHCPQLHHRCRTGLKSKRKSYVEKHGVTTTPPEVAVTPGFGFAPNLTEIPKPSQRVHPPDADIQLEMAKKAYEDAQKRKPLRISNKHVAPNPLTAKELMHEQLAGPGGSNAGGVYLGADGVKRYVKLYDDSAQAAGEHLANRLYADLGLGEVKSVLFEHNGKLAYASEFIDGAIPIGMKGLTPELAAKALDGLAADIACANWDAVGLSLDNMLVTPSGGVLRVDNGGAFLMRASAGRKPAALLEQIPEWEGFFDGNVNLAYSKVAQVAGVSSPADMLDRFEKQLVALETLEAEAGGWGPYVRKNAPLLDEADSEAIATMLRARSNLMRNRVRSLRRAKKKAPPSFDLAKVDVERIPTQVEHWPGYDSPPRTGTELLDYSRAIRELSQKRLLDKLNIEEIQAIGAFTEDSTHIRAASVLTESEYLVKFPDSSAAKYAAARRHADNLFSALAKGRKNRPAGAVENKVTELFRGIRNLDKARFDAVLASGVLRWDEPTSTSWDPDVSRDFYRPLNEEHRNNYSIFFRIKPRKPTSSLSVEGTSAVQSERELLYGKARFRVVRIVRDGDFERGAVVYLEEI
jgi:hypothetical protein